MTVKLCAEAYIAVHKAGSKTRSTRRSGPATLATFAYPVIGDLPSVGALRACSIWRGCTDTEMVKTRRYAARACSCQPRRVWIAGWK